MTFKHCSIFFHFQGVYTEMNRPECKYQATSTTFLYSSWYPQYQYPCPIFLTYGPYWFLSTILFCYMVFPFFMMVIQKCINTKNLFPIIAILFWIQNLLAFFTANWLNEKNKVNCKNLINTITII